MYRLLQIITYNNRTNRKTIFTEVSYDLGKDLINRGNTKLLNSK